MTVLNQDFNIFRGDTREMTFPIRKIKMVDGAEVDLGPIDLAGFQIRWWAVDENGVQFVQKSTAGGSIAAVNVDGVPPTVLDAVRFTILPADTLPIEPRGYYHECEAVDLANNVSTVFTGYMTVARDKVI